MEPNTFFLTPKEVIQFSGALMLGVSGLITFVFTSFATKNELKQMKEEQETRLMRIETKLDRLIERKIK